MRGDNSVVSGVLVMLVLMGHKVNLVPKVNLVRQASLDGMAGLVHLAAVVSFDLKSYVL